MAISSNQRKGRKNWSALNGQKTRPIEREMFDEDRENQKIFAMKQDSKLLNDPRVDLRRRFNSQGSAGKTIAPPVGGGTYEPGGNAPTNTTIGTT